MIRKDTDYAFRILLYLGLVTTKPVSAERIARQLEIPQSFAQKILRKLVTAQVLAAKPGCGGGFTLAKEPNAISMMDVIKAVQGSILISPCAADRDNCLRSVGCPVRPRWSELQKRLSGFLFRETLADLLKSRRRARSKRYSSDGKARSARARTWRIQR